jgi:hypothetical protein
MSPLLWTSKSTEHLAAALRQLGHKVSWKTVGRMLKAKGFSLQANRNSNEGGIHPDREGQFAHINAQAVGFQEDEQPVISADTRKKNHAAPELAVQTIRIWWQQMGQPMYPDATRLLVTADCGGNNGHRAQAWKRSLQQLANETGLIISVCHFPPGTSKWSRIEQRMSCHITQHRRGLPPVRLEAVVSLIGAVATRQGPRIRTDRDPHQSEMGRKITGHDLAEVRSGRPEFPENWNYSLLPNDK